ncbi:hypothetical protein HZZ00_37660 (plasmid) [Streptomyces sp. NEAU-sy36]|nr:hypothetical protein [Streptomyces sp. NEAU-sy36]QLJ06760.1 hypothetical protein HZZ00_37660 [Streptomyces sp. NEAU-sy36]
MPIHELIHQAEGFLHWYDLIRVFGGDLVQVVRWVLLRPGAGRHRRPRG